MARRWRVILKRVLSDERGSMPVVAAIFAIAFVACTVVVIDHHQHLSSLALARETSYNAARAAGQKVDETSLGNSVAPTLNEAEARTAAEEIVAEVPTVDVQSIDVDGAEVVVVVAVTSDGILQTKTFTGTGRAEAIDPNR